MMSSKRWGQVQLRDESGGFGLAVANEINTISRTFEIHVRIIIIRALFVDKEGRMPSKIFKIRLKGKILYYILVEIKFGLMDATKR